VRYAGVKCPCANASHATASPFIAATTPSISSRICGGGPCCACTEGIAAITTTKLATIEIERSECGMTTFLSEIAALRC
jgi:hypothetical protein